MYPRLRGLREDHDMTQKQIAERLNIAQSGYSCYEQKENIPTDMLLKLADFYHTSVDYLLGKTDEPRPYPPSGGRKTPLPKF